MKPAFQTLELVDRPGGVLELRLNRPEVSNAIDTRMATDLLDAFTWLVREGEAVRCVMLTGAGRNFCAGGDLKQRQGMTDEEWRAQHRIMEQAVLAMLDLPMPTIAAVNGAAFGGGCELVLNVDFAYAATDARFALTEVGLGIMPGAGGTQNLPRAVGLRRANELIFTARRFSAQEAHDWGMVNGLAASDALSETVLGVAGAIAANAPLAVRQAKISMRLGLEMDRRSALFLEVEAYNRLVATHDRREGVLAFAEKRKPRFEGR
jgi:enoyl-CoA hydratase/carnithine racemase